MTTTTTDRRESIVEGLAKFVEFLREHPEVTPPILSICSQGGSPAEVKAAVDAFVRGAEGQVEKTVPYENSPNIRLMRHFGEYRVWLDFDREALGCRKVTKMVPTESWECGPILSGIKEVEK